MVDFFRGASSILDTRIAFSGVMKPSHGGNMGYAGERCQNAEFANVCGN
jgi:hypothetical protein